MIKEAYVSFEVAKLLKEKGFNEMTELAYELEDGHIRNDLPVSYWRNSEIGKYKFSCPTHQMAMKWLRDEKNILITVIPQEIQIGVDKLCYGIYRITEDLYQPLYNGRVDTLVDSYEEVVETALKYCLENLI